mmetsp:Transcript_18001/g.30126  ORF Transcript_18001/g.30126 Transcript_18001/m.30126 type:complete len:155 (+) Transcript_18001:177-641(+)
MPKNKSKNKFKNKNKTFKTGMNSSKEFNKPSKISKNTKVTVPVKRHFKSAFEEELNNLKERNGQISNAKSVRKAKPIQLAPATFTPANNHGENASDSPVLQKDSELQEQSQTQTTIDPTIGKASNAYDALAEPDAAKFKFSLKPSMLTSISKVS